MQHGASRRLRGGIELAGAVWQYDVNGDKLANGKPLIDMTLDGKSGFPDGLRVDTGRTFLLRMLAVPPGAKRMGRVAW